MIDNRKRADDSWKFIDAAWAKSQSPTRYNRHRLEFFRKYPHMRMALPPGPRGGAKQWHVLCEVPNCMMAQTQRNFSTHKRMRCAEHTYGLFDGHVLVAPHLRRQAHRLIRVGAYEHRKGRSHRWYVSCENMGCSKEVDITYSAHEHRRLCRRCVYVSEGSVRIKDPQQKETALKCIVAFRFCSGNGKRKIRQPLMRCVEPECENLILFSAYRFKTRGLNWRCKRCQGKCNRLRPYEAFYNYLVASSLKRRISMELSYNQFVEIMKVNKCWYCSRTLEMTPFSRGYKKRAISKTSLDRMDNELGYTFENTVVCCSVCNLTKFRWIHAHEMRVLGALRNGNLELAGQIARATLPSIQEHAKKLKNINFAVLSRRIARP